MNQVPQPGTQGSEVLDMMFVECEGKAGEEKGVEDREECKVNEAKVLEGLGDVGLVWCRVIAYVLRGRSPGGLIRHLGFLMEAGYDLEQELVGKV